MRIRYHLGSIWIVLLFRFFGMSRNKLAMVSSEDLSFPSSRQNWIHVTMSSPNYIRTMPVETRKPTTDTLTKDMRNLPGQGPIYIIVDALGRRSDL